MKFIHSLIFIVSLCGTGVATAQNNLLIDDDANRADNPSLGTTNNGLTWTEGGISASPDINSNLIQFDANGANGIDYATVDLSSLSPAWNAVLTDNTGIIEWRFNMRIVSNKLTGFNSGGNGVAFVLAANSPDLSLGEGYAVVLGNPGAAKPVRLVHYTGGLDDNANLTNIMFAGDFSAGEFLAVFVQ